MKQEKDVVDFEKRLVMSSIIDADFFDGGRYMPSYSEQYAIRTGNMVKRTLHCGASLISCSFQIEAYENLSSRIRSLGLGSLYPHALPEVIRPLASVKTPGTIQYYRIRDYAHINCQTIGPFESI